MDEQFKIQLDMKSSTPLFEQIYQVYKSRISDGILSPGTVLPPERTLIKELGLARTTLRRALEELEKQGFLCRRQGIGTFVTDHTLWKSHQESMLLGIITWNETFGGYSREIFGHLCAESASQGIRVHAIGAFEGLNQPAAWAKQLHLNAVIAMPTNRLADIRHLADIHLPKLIMEMRHPQDGLDHVVLDSVPGVYSSVKELIALGHRDIAYVGGLVRNYDEETMAAQPFKMAQDSAFRAQAWREALEDSGIVYRADRLYEINYETESAQALVKQLLKNNNMPTAFVVFSDSLAQNIINACQANGVGVPGKVSVVGFGNSTPEARRGELATVSYDLKKMASMAVQRITERVRYGGIAGITLNVPNRFKKGNSIGPV